MSSDTSASASVASPVSSPVSSQEAKVPTRKAPNPAAVAARAARVNAHLSSKSFAPRKSKKHCFAYFGRERKCEKGDECLFSHDAESYKQERGLKDCPNDGCPYFCLESSNQCSACVNFMYEERSRQRAAEKEARRAEFASRPDKECQGSWRNSDGEEVYCENTTKSRLCSGCFQAEKQYLIRH
jgi:hypothetical protein